MSSMMRENGFCVRLNLAHSFLSILSKWRRLARHVRPSVMESTRSFRLALTSSISTCFIRVISTMYPTQTTAPLCFWAVGLEAVSYTHLRAHETKANLVCRLLLEKKKQD